MKSFPLGPPTHITILDYCDKRVLREISAAGLDSTGYPESTTASSARREEDSSPLLCKNRVEPWVVIRIENNGVTKTASLLWFSISYNPALYSVL